MLSRLTITALLAAAGFAADITGLQLQSEAKITASMLGAPFEGDHPPSIWAVSFSPDGEKLAIGVQFRKTKKAVEFKSYAFVVAVSQPNVILEKFETPTQALVPKLHHVVWSADSRFIVFTPFGDWDHAGVVDVDAARMHSVPDRDGVPWCGEANGVLSDPAIVQGCHLGGGKGSAVRVIGLNGRTKLQWDIGNAFLLDVSPDGNMVALDFLGRRSSGGALTTTHDIVILNLADRTEVRRWSYPESGLYWGKFSNGSDVLCTTPGPTDVGSEHRITCRFVKSGALAFEKTFPMGPIFAFRVVGDRLFVDRAKTTLLPRFLWWLGTSYVLGDAHQELTDIRSGELAARWTIPLVSDFESSVSTDGEAVAIGRGGQLRIYRVHR